MTHLSAASHFTKHYLWWHVCLLMSVSFHSHTSYSIIMLLRLSNLPIPFSIACTSVSCNNQNVILRKKLFHHIIKFANLTNMNYVGESLCVSINDNFIRKDREKTLQLQFELQQSAEWSSGFHLRPESCHTIFSVSPIRGDRGKP